jgi:hypothetical protein
MNHWQRQADPVSGSSPWTISGEDIFRTPGNVGIGTMTPREKLDVTGGRARVAGTGGEILLDSSVGALQILTPGEDLAGTFEITENGAGLLQTTGPAGSRNVALTALVDNEDSGVMNVFSAEDEIKTQMVADPDTGAGQVLLIGGNGNINVDMSSFPSYPNHGFFGTADENGEYRSLVFTDQAGEGWFSVLNSAGEERSGLNISEEGDGVVFGNFLSADNPEGQSRAALFADSFGEGVLSILTAQGTERAGAFIDGSGRGVVFGDLIAVFDSEAEEAAGISIDDQGRGVVFGDQKSFIVDYPGKPGHKITYISLEGPEGAIFCRGRVRLESGRGTIILPEHFAALAQPDSLTVQLTPGSLSSRGVAFEQISRDRIDVGELQGGTGSYEVHYVVHARRADLADFQPVSADAPVRAKSLKGTKSRALPERKPGVPVNGLGSQKAALRETTDSRS